MPIPLHMEPLHTGTDLELSNKLSRECTSTYEIVLRALKALGWQQDQHRDAWSKPDGTDDPPTITSLVIADFSHNGDVKALTQIMHDMGWKREARIIHRAHEDLPIFIRVANTLTGARR